MPRLSGRVSSRVVRHDGRQAPAWALWPKCGACAWCRGRQSELGVRLAPICPAWSVVAELAFAPLLVRAERALRCRPRRNRRRMGAYRFADRDGESERRRSLRLAQGNSRSHRRRPPEQLARRRASLELPELVKLIAGGSARIAYSSSARCAEICPGQAGKFTKMLVLAKWLLSDVMRALTH